MSQATNAISRKKLWKPKITIQREGRGISDYNGCDRAVKQGFFFPSFMVCDPLKKYINSPVECFKS